VNVWIPTKDTGVDLLVSDRKNKKAVSLQVKFSRDFLATHMDATAADPLSGAAEINRFHWLADPAGGDRIAEQTTR
jgi:hypothetical protein